MKKYLLLMLSITVASFAAEVSLINKEATQVAQVDFLSVLTQEINPETTVLAFDLNDVVFKKNIPQIIRYSLYTLIKGGFWHVMWPSFWKKVKEYGAQNNCKEYIFEKLKEDYPALAHYEQDFQALSTCQKVIPNTLQILKDLKAQGFKLYIFSNMGEKTINTMKAKFADVFDLFDGQYVPSVENNYNFKPNTTFYQEFKEYLTLQGQGNKQVIFSDDKLENLQEAYRNDIAGILVKNPETIQDQLDRLNVIVGYCKCDEE